MSAVFSPRRQAINAVFEYYFAAQKEPTLKTLRELVSAIQAFIRKSPHAFADLSNAIGNAQDLLLLAAAKEKRPNRSKQYIKWEAQIGNARLSCAGQTRPEWLKSNGVSAGILLRWKAPSLNGGDDGKESDDDIAKETLFGNTCECAEMSDS